MYEVKVNKEELLTILKFNRERHQEIYKKAFVGYREEVIQHLEFILSEILEKDGKINTKIDLIVPQDHTAEYDRIIGMLEMSVDETIEIDGTEYRQYILDEWDWSKNFSSTSSSYSSGSSTSSFSDLRKLYL